LVPSDYVLGPDDELRIRVWGQVSFQINVRVDRSGEVFLPQVGTVHVAGLPISALDAQLRSAIGRVYRNFDLTVNLGQIGAIQVYVAGQARRPGVYTVSSLSTLVDALFASGGPSTRGSMRHILLRRNGSLVTDFDLYNLIIRGDKSKDVKLQSGDVIFIPPAGPQVAVTGSIGNPAIYELQESETLVQLVADAGGVSSVAEQTRVSIERIEGHLDRQAMEVKYDATGMATAMRDGDLVHVYSITPVYKNTVVLRGNTANPGRFGWHPGMRISDLIPDKESLITRNYWWRRTQLGISSPEFEPTARLEDLRQPNNGAITMNRPLPEDIGSTSYLSPMPSGPTPSSPIPRTDSLQPEETGKNPNPVAEQRAGSASLASAENSLSERRPSTEQARMKGGAPEIDWDYAVIERLNSDTMTTVLVAFDLGSAVLRHDASQDLELQPGDVVTIFSDADIRVPIAHQTKTVRLDGEFAHAGLYTAEPGETLRHLVERAGGLTPNAYLYGSEFTRESTRAQQQSRIEEYVQSMGMRLQRDNLAASTSPAASQQDAALASSAQSSERELLEGLRQLRATGRIVLELKPSDSGILTLPDVALENGDSFTVPPVPASVNVVGAVFDQNSFLYQQSRSAGAYLQLAGGPNKDADDHHEFIIRADGEVVSRESAHAKWGVNEFNNLPVNPGDTIVVPEKSFKLSALRGVLDWSQLFSQFALGAAALSVIH
jgi:protein involved in polysaccharide export with SLBB domain